MAKKRADRAERQQWAFTEDQVIRLTGLTRRKLRYWARDFFPPTYPVHRMYAFRDLVGLRTIARLQQHGLKLPFLRKAAMALKERYAEPWSQLRFYLAGRTMYVQAPDAEGVMAAMPLGQLPIEAASFDLKVASVEDEAERSVRKINARPRASVGKVERRRDVQSNAWCFKGTRVPLAAVISLLNAGRSQKDILEEFPSLSPGDVRAAPAHAHKLGKPKRAA